MPDLSRLAEDAPEDTDPPGRLEAWMDGYIAAWSSNDPVQIGALFSSDAVYDPQTADGEIHGADEISAWWREIGDDSDNWDFRMDAPRRDRRRRDHHREDEILRAARLVPESLGDPFR